MTANKQISNDKNVKKYGTNFFPHVAKVIHQLRENHFLRDSIRIQSEDKDLFPSNEIKVKVNGHPLCHFKRFY